MGNLTTIWEKRTSIWSMWMVVAAAILITAVGTAALPRTASASTHDPPELRLVHCVCDGNVLLWRTGNNGEAEAPGGWKVEREHRDSEGNSVVRTFTFIGDEADALLTSGRDHWSWEDRSIDQNVRYTYRVRAINSDGSDVEGSDWSKSTSSTCLAGPLAQPGLSISMGQDNGVSMFWHTMNRGQANAPDGWKVERRHWDSEGWVVRTFTFIGAEADALQTFNEQYWDWVDTTADQGVAYTYRVRAIKADGSDMDGRVWSRRAPAEW